MVFLVALKGQECLVSIQKKRVMIHVKLTEQMLKIILMKQESEEDQTHPPGCRPETN